jgi:hypothetical protein
MVIQPADMFLHPKQYIERKPKLKLLLAQGIKQM